MYISVPDAAEKDNISKGQVLINKIDSEHLTIEQVCDIFSISLATAKNWIRLGKLHTESDSETFSKTYIENLLAEIKSGKDNRLKSRRNKKNVTGKVLYKDYIKNESNREVVQKILNSCDHISEAELRIILAHFAIQLYSQCGGIVGPDHEWLQKQTPISNHSVFNALITDLLENVNIENLDLVKIKSVFNYQIQFVSAEDTLGFIYISLRDLGQRKQTGAYYTPAKTVNMLIDSLLNCLDFENKTVCDPCCGTGNFLIGLLGNGVRINDLYGQDRDEISIFITRINMFLRNHDLSKEQLDTHFICRNTLENTFSMTFSIVLGNPPWGYDFSKEETLFLEKNYRTAKSKGTESYDLFIEKGLALLEEKGYLAYVLPEALLSVKSHLPARELIIKNTSFRFVSYLGNSFSGVQCPAILLGLQKDGQEKTKQCRVMFDHEEFTITKDRNMDAIQFSFHMNDNEYDCLQAIESVQNVKYLANNAKFALGIVTGDNKKSIKDKKEDGFEIILKGSDIFRYSIRNTNNYIRYTPDTFQQVAPTEIYRAKEKLLYRFICEIPVFAYDNNQTLSLNSCNILIPQIEGMNMKYILAVLNSSVAAYFINKKFNSIKLLRAHIESLPIPMISAERQNEIIKKVDYLMNAKENICDLYEELDHDIMEIFSLQTKHRDTIHMALSQKNLFLPRG